MITIYGKPNCGWCDKAKQVADLHGLKYEYKDITFTKFREELFNRAPTTPKTVPQIFWYDKYIGGYDKFSTEVENTINGYGEQNF